jgi:hypothetical protein
VSIREHVRLGHDDVACNTLRGERASVDLR